MASDIKMAHFAYCLSHPQISHKQKGIVLIVTLISLTVLMLAGAALMRSTDTSLLIAGNIAFKRDALNQAERALPVIRTIFATGALATSTSRENDLLSSNYYATLQPSNTVGIPTELLDKAAFDAKFGSKNIVESGVTIRYLIDRLSFQTGACSASICAVAQGAVAQGGDATNNICSTGCNAGPVSASASAVYRISVSATGLRNVETYMQYTFTI